jgi:hypothetical protein
MLCTVLFVSLLNVCTGFEFFFGVGETTSHIFEVAYEIYRLARLIMELDH